MSHELNLAQMLALIAGALALFLFGLELMTAALKAVAGPGMQVAQIMAFNLSAVTHHYPGGRIPAPCLGPSRSSSSPWCLNNYVPEAKY
jgi:hypothetical protein